MKKIPKEIEALLEKSASENKIFNVINEKVRQLDGGNSRVKYLNDLANLFRNREKNLEHFKVSEQKKIDRLIKSSRYSTVMEKELNIAIKDSKETEREQKTIKSLIPRINELATYYKDERTSPMQESQPSTSKINQREEQPSTSRISQREEQPSTSRKYQKAIQPLKSKKSPLEIKISKVNEHKDPKSVSTSKRINTNKKNLEH